MSDRAPSPNTIPHARRAAVELATAPAPRHAALPEEERLRLGLPMKLPLRPSGRQLQRMGQRRRTRSDTNAVRVGVLVVTARRVMLAPTHGSTASIMLEEPFQAHLSRWETSQDGGVEVGVSLRQGDQTVELCVQLGADEVDTDALALRELDAPRLSDAHFAAVWEVLGYYARLHGNAQRLSAVRPRERAQVREREEVAKPEAFLVREDHEGLTVWAKAPPDIGQLELWLKAPKVVLWVAVAAAIASFEFAHGASFAVALTVCAAVAAGAVYGSMVLWRRLCRRDARFRGRVIAEGERLRVTGLVEAGEAFDAHNVALGTLEQLYVALTTRPKRSTKHLKAESLGPPLEDHEAWWALYGLARDGERIALVEPLEMEEALFLELTLERHLGMDDRAVEWERVPGPGEAGGVVEAGASAARGAEGR